MIKKEIKEIIKNGISPVKLWRVFMNYDANYRYYLQLKASDKLFWGADEYDFIFQYHLRHVQLTLCRSIFKISYRY
jgi:hypothetical protein